MTISLDIGSPGARWLIRRCGERTHELFPGCGLERRHDAVATQAVQASALHAEQARIEPTFSQQEPGEIERPNRALSGDAEGGLERGKGVAARDGIVARGPDGARARVFGLGTVHGPGEPGPGTVLTGGVIAPRATAARHAGRAGGTAGRHQLQALDPAADLDWTFPLRAALHDEGPVVGEEVADGLIERGTERQRIGVAKEPTRMRREAEPAVGLVVLAHQRLDLRHDGNGIQDSDAVRQLGVEELDELGWALFHQLEVEVLVMAHRPHRERRTERELRMTAETGRIGDGDAGSPERPVDEPHEVEMRDEAHRLRLLEPHPVAPRSGSGGAPPRPPAAVDDAASEGEVGAR
jgi:hypothetical protein